MEWDNSLQSAYACWKAPLEAGIRLLERQEAKQAEKAFSEAVHNSARFHPLYHFLESGLHTELGILYLQQEKFDDAEKAFTRAVFLHHDNIQAKSGLQAAKSTHKSLIAPYPLMDLIAPLGIPGSAILEYRARSLNSNVETAIALHHQAIFLCETAHKDYHAIAALPFLWRARAFLKLDQPELARNDIRRGLDLDKANPELIALHAMHDAAKTRFPANIP